MLLIFLSYNNIFLQCACRVRPEDVYFSSLTFWEWLVKMSKVIKLDIDAFASTKLIFND